MPRYEFTYYPDEFAVFGCKTAVQINEIQNQIQADHKGCTVKRSDISVGDFNKAQFVVERNPRK